MHHTVVLCVALLIVFYGALNLNVSRVRRKRRRDASMPEAALTKAIRAHGNAAGMLLIPTVKHRHPLRYVGALGTYLCLFALGGALLVDWVQAVPSVALSRWDKRCRRLMGLRRPVQSSPGDPS